VEGGGALRLRDEAKGTKQGEKGKENQLMADKLMSEKQRGKNKKTENQKPKGKWQKGKGALPRVP
jgi:hypothetical protein